MVPKTYLEGAQGQFEEQLDLHGILWGEGEDNVVDAKERDQQEGGLGQAPGDTGTCRHSPSDSAPVTEGSTCLFFWICLSSACLPTSVTYLCTYQLFIYHLSIIFVCTCIPTGHLFIHHLPVFCL